MGKPAQGDWNLNYIYIFFVCFMHTSFYSISFSFIFVFSFKNFVILTLSCIHAVIQF